MKWRFLLVLGCLQIVGACAKTQTVFCDDGYVCPANLTCAPNGGCASTIQIANCEGRQDGASCETGIGSGSCSKGVCLSAQCGNGRVDDGELCDDGNTASADGCRSDCRKIEVCGDREVDEGEDCDDGNANIADGCSQCRTTTWVASTTLADDLVATSETLASPSGVVLDENGNLYLADRENQRIRKVAPDGTITTFAGTGTRGFSGDGGVATAANLDTPVGLAIDGLGNLYIADRGNFRIRRVDTLGIITTVAGTGTAGYDPFHENIAATSAYLNNASGVAVDGLGNIYIGDRFNHRVRKVDQDGIITTVAGTGTPGFNGDNIAASDANLNNPVGVATDQAGTLYIADAENHRIRKVTLDGVITTIAGTGDAGFNGDGNALASQVNGPTNIALAGNNLFIGDYGNNRVRKVDLDQGTMVTVAGTTASGYNGDNIAATSASLHQPSGVDVDEAGAIYIGDKLNQRVRKINSLGMITTLAGTGTRTFDQDNTAATSVSLYGAQRVSTDEHGNLFVADTDSHRVRKVATDGVVTTVAGDGLPGYRSTDDGELANKARLNQPLGVAVDSDGSVYVADTYNQRIRKIDTDGIITTVAGTGTEGYDPANDGGPAASAALFRPRNVALDELGNIYIASGLNCIRKIDQNGIITTIAGTGVRASSPDGPAFGATLNASSDVAVDSQNNVYVAEAEGRQIRKIDSDGNMTTVAGTGADGYSPADEGALATMATLSRPVGLALDANGNIYIAEPGANRIRKVGTDGIIRTIAGNGAEGFDGDGLAATDATVWEPRSVAVDAVGNVFFTQGDRQSFINGDPSAGSFVRRVGKASSLLSTVAGHVAPSGLGPFASARAADPRALATVDDGLLVAGGISGTVQRLWAQRQWIGAVAGRYLQALPSANLARFRGFDFGRVGGVAYDSTNKVIYLSESSRNRIYRVLTDKAVDGVFPDDPNSWTIEALTGTNAEAGFADGPASTAKFRDPTGLYFDDVLRALYVADKGNHVVRAVYVDAAVVTTIAGTPGTLGYAGDGEGPLSSRLYEPEALTKCPNGDLFIADTGNHRVRRIDAQSQTITTVLGVGIPASSGEGMPAAAFPVDSPAGLACDEANNLFVTSRTTVRMLPASDPAPGLQWGTVDGTGQVQTIYGASTQNSFPASATLCLTGIVVDGSELRIADSCSGLIVELERVVVQDD